MLFFYKNISSLAPPLLYPPYIPLLLLAWLCSFSLPDYFLFFSLSVNLSQGSVNLLIFPSSLFSLRTIPSFLLASSSKVFPNIFSQNEIQVFVNNVVDNRRCTLHNYSKTELIKIQIFYLFILYTFLYTNAYYCCKFLNVRLNSHRKLL